MLWYGMVWLFGWWRLKPLIEVFAVIGRFGLSLVRLVGRGYYIIKTFVVAVHIYIPSFGIDEWLLKP